jgi:ABC-type multidrug transport system fused ATPase/permease subunit
MFQKLSYLLSSKQRKHAIFIIFFMCIGMLLETIGITIIFPLIKLISQPESIQNSSFIPESLKKIARVNKNNFVLFFLFFLSIFFVVKFLFLYTQLLIQQKFIFNIRASISNNLFKGYLNEPYSFHLNHNSAELISTVTNDVGLLAYVLTSAIMFVAEFTVFIGISGILFFIYPVVMISVTIIVGIIGALFQYLTKKRIYNWGEIRQIHERKRIQQLQQGLGAIKDVKLRNLENYFSSHFFSSNSLLSNAEMKQSVLTSLPRLFFELLASLSMIGLILFAVLKNTPIESLLTTVAVFATASFRIVPSLNRIFTTKQTFRYGAPTIDALYKEVVRFDKNKKSKSTTNLLFQKELKLEGISFSYENTEKTAIRDVNLTISKGQKIGFIGPSGAGKSTLIDVILGLLRPQEGKLTIDGIDILENLANWQSMLGYVPQNIYFTDDTLRNNIAFGIQEELIDEIAIESAIKAANLDKFISELPLGLDTIIGERGIRISGGQRQRIGIARALYTNPDILVLDEATSALDINTEKEVMASVDSLMNKTVLIISHRLSSIQNCDKVYKVKDGLLDETLIPKDLIHQI